MTRNNKNKTYLNKSMQQQNTYFKNTKILCTLFMYTEIETIAVLNTLKNKITL